MHVHAEAHTRPTNSHGRRETDLYMYIYILYIYIYDAYHQLMWICQNLRCDCAALPASSHPLLDHIALLLS